MPTIKAFITKHAVATYFALTFAISWGGVLAAAGPKIPATREEFGEFSASLPKGCRVTATRGFVGIEAHVGSCRI